MKFFWSCCVMEELLCLVKGVVMDSKNLSFDEVVLFGLVESIKDYNTLLRLIAYKALSALYSMPQSRVR